MMNCINFIDSTFSNTKSRKSTSSASESFSVLTGEIHRVPNGNYQVDLHFSEIFWGVIAPGEREFDVNIENTLAHDNLNVAESGGGSREVVVLSTIVAVTDGALSISFEDSGEVCCDLPFVSAVQIFTAGNTPSPQSPTDSPAGMPAGSCGSLANCQLVDLTTLLPIGNLTGTGTVQYSVDATGTGSYSIACFVGGTPDLITSTYGSGEISTVAIGAPNQFVFLGGVDNTDMPLEIDYLSFPGSKTISVSLSQNGVECVNFQQDLVATASTPPTVSPPTVSPPTAVRGTIYVTNNAPLQGTCQTPVWLGIHDGTFDLYNQGEPVSAALQSLAEDGDNDPLIEAFGIAPGGVFDGVTNGGPICPGETVQFPFDLDLPGGVDLYLSYASMILPSNDAFVANGDPMEHLFFSAGGMIQDVEICVLGDEVLDAGSEVNDEIPMNTAFFGQTVDGTGVDQGGVIQLHPGFLPAGSGGILDSAMFSNADFTVSGYKVLTICVALEGEEARCMIPPLATSQPTSSPTRAPSNPTSGPGLVAAFNSGGTGKKIVGERSACSAHFFECSFHRQPRYSVVERCEHPCR